MKLFLSKLFYAQSKFLWNLVGNLPFTVSELKFVDYFVTLIPLLLSSKYIILYILKVILTNKLLYKSVSFYLLFVSAGLENKTKFSEKMYTFDKNDLQMHYCHSLTNLTFMPTLKPSSYIYLYILNIYNCL